MRGEAESLKYMLQVLIIIMYSDSYTERFFGNQVFTLYDIYIGTMPRFVQSETWDNLLYKNMSLVKKLPEKKKLVKCK